MGSSLAIFVRLRSACIINRLGVRLPLCRSPSASAVRTCSELLGEHTNPRLDGLSIVPIGGKKRAGAGDRCFNVPKDYGRQQDEKSGPRTPP
jgi:hypothetical protein